MGTWLLLEQDIRHVGGGADQAEALGVERELGEVGQGRGVSGARRTVPTPPLPGTGKPRAQAALCCLPAGVGVGSLQDQGFSQVWGASDHHPPGPELPAHGGPPLGTWGPGPLSYLSGMLISVFLQPDHSRGTCYC